MWKAPGILLLCVVFGSVLSQDVTFDCVFVETDGDEYACMLHGIELLDPSVNVIFGGTHAEGRTNADVNVVSIDNSITPFVIQQIFTTFPNIDELTIENSGLQTISLPDTVELQWIYLFNNNITRIENGTFRSQPSLLFIYIVRSNVEFIEEDAFEGLTNLVSLAVIENRIANFAPKTFQSLASVTYVDLERNNLTSISEQLFSGSTNLRLLYLEHNQINAIAPGFDTSLRDTLLHINLLGNVCVGRSFPLLNEQDWMTLEGGLATCFNNFVNGTVPETRRITMEFVGTMSFYDESGNLIVSV